MSTGWLCPEVSESELFIEKHSSKQTKDDTNERSANNIEWVVNSNIDLRVTYCEGPQVTDPGPFWKIIP